MSFPLISDTALIARGSKLRVTLSWTTTAQNAANLLYLTGVPDGSSLTIKSARITLPVLRTAVSVMKLLAGIFSVLVLATCASAARSRRIRA